MAKRRDQTLIGCQARREIAWSASSAATCSPGAPTSLPYPHESATRSTRDLSGLWRFQLDSEGKGEGARWFDGQPQSRTIPVPSSWNDLFDDARNYTDAAWYQTEFHLDPAWRGRVLHLRFGSAVYRARAWLNGRLLGEHLGGTCPSHSTSAPLRRSTGRTGWSCWSRTACAPIACRR